MNRKQLAEYVSKIKGNLEISLRNRKTHDGKGNFWARVEREIAQLNDEVKTINDGPPSSVQAICKKHNLGEFIDKI